MADSKISALADGSPASATDEVPVSKVANVATRKLSLDAIRTLFSATFANISHTHPESDITGLIADLAAIVLLLNDHNARHENGGPDEILVTGLSGLLADGQTPLAHKTTHQDGGSDEISVAGLSGLLADGQTPLAHKTSHQDGGSDEILVTGLSGLLNDAQKVTVRKNTGADVGTRPRLNLIEGANVTLTVADDAGGNEVDVTIAASGAGGGAPTDAEYLVSAAHAGLSAERVTTDTATVAWDHTVAAQAKANVPDDAITDAKLRNSAALSVIGKATNSVGNPADIVASANGQFLKRQSDALGFTTISASDIPAHAASHQDGGADEISVAGLSGQLADAQKVTVRKNTGADVGTRPRLNLIEGTNVTLTIADDAGSGEVDITIAASGAGGGAPTDAEYLTSAAHAGLSAERVTTDTPTVTWDHTVAAQAKANVPDDAITDAKLRNSAAVSVIGRSVNSAGNPADIAAGGNGQYLQRNSDVVGFATIPAADLPAHASRHQDGGADEISVTGLSGTLNDAQKVTVRKNSGADVGTRPKLNLIEGSNITLTVADDAGGNEVDITIAAAGGGSGSPGGSDKHVQYNDGGAFGGEAGFEYDKTTDQLTVPGLAVTQDFALTGDISPSSLSSDQDDYNPTNLATSAILRIDLTASINISGLQQGTDGQIKTLFNVSTDFMILLSHEDPASSAANRFSFGTALACYILLPGEGCTFWYDATSSRWRYLHGHHPATMAGQFDIFDDCHWIPDIGLNNTLSSGPFGVNVSGTAANATMGAAGIDATEKAQGVVTLDTGSTAAGRASIASGTNGIVPTVGGALFIARVAIDTLSDGTQTYTVKIGLHTGANGTDASDGVYWEYAQAASTDWMTVCANTNSRTKTVITGLTIGSPYVTLGIWINPGWTRADFFHSLDGVSWTVSADGTQSGANFPTSQFKLVSVSNTITKSAGTSVRNLHTDYIGVRFPNQQR